MEVLLEYLGGTSPLNSIATVSIATVMWGTLYVLAGFWAVHSLLLLYHWIRYGGAYALTWIVMIVHAAVSLTLIGIMLGAVLFIT